MHFLLPSLFTVALPLVGAAPHCSLKSEAELQVSGAATTPDNDPSGNQTFVAAAWYAAWHSDDFPLSKVSWSKYSSMIYAFA